MEKQKNPTANLPAQERDEPLGDRGKGDKSWSPEPGEQGISNRIGDEGTDTGPDAEDGLPEDAKKRVPS
jgi:hypothetical protein